MKSLESSRWSRAAKTSAALFLIALFTIIPAAQAAQTLVDDFESYTVGNTPTGWTNGPSVAFTASTDFAHGGTKSGKFVYSNLAALTGSTSPTGLNFCTAGNQLTLWFYLAALPTGSNHFRYIYKNAAGGPAASVSITVSSSGALEAWSDTGSSFQSLGASATAGNWFDLNTYNVACGGSSTTFSVASNTLAFSKTFTTTDIFTDISKIQLGASGAIPNVNPPSATITAYIDDLGIGGYVGLPISATSVAQTSIVGFDILKNAGNVATRDGTGGSQLITVMDGTTLSQTANLATQCNRLHGLTNMGDMGWAYIHCNNTGSHNPDAIIFVNGIGGATYPFSPACSQTAYSCDASIDISGSGITSGDRDSISDLAPGIAGEFYSTGQNPSTHRQQIITGFNIATTQSANSNLLDANMGWTLQDISTTASTTAEHFHTTTSSDTTGVAGDICGFGNLRIFKATQGGPVKGYSITLNNNANVNPPPGGSADLLPAPTYTQTFTGTVDALLTGTYIDCATDRIVVDSATQLSVWNYATNSLVFTKTITGGSYNTISGNGSYAAYSDGTKTYIISGSTGNQLGFITNPGTLVDMEMDQCAQNLYLATATNVYRYNITGNTTGTVVSVSNGSCVVGSGITNSNSNTGTASSGSNTCGLLGCSHTGSTTGTGNNVSGPAQHTGNPLGDLVQFIKNSWGFDWSWIIGAVLMAICLVAVDKATHGSPLADSLVIVLVCVSNIKLGLWPEWSLILLAFLIIAVAGNRMFNREREDTA